VQALWIYLEAVFSGGDIARQLPQEAKRFQNIDKSWVKIMLAAAEMPNVIKLCFGDEMLRNLLPHLLESLEICQKSLSGYLEAKRQVFPRFYFVSDGQLLEILGQGSDPHTIQPHLLSIFSNIARVEFDKVARGKILAMESSDGEHVELTEPLMCEGNIEDWLNKLVRTMQRTICDICASMMAEVDTIREGEKDVVEQFFDKYAAQIGLLAIQILWTVMCEEALIKSKTDKGAPQTANKQFQKLLAVLVDLTTRDMSKMDRTKIETLITIHIHQVDIFASLVKQRIRNVQDFEWLKQTRFYWKPEEEKVLISITDVDFQYRWEYTGCRERLVITPLTDRIYISCAQAMGMYYGGAPAGPAGTGKTETVKDMGASCGRYFITINCSDQMDYRGMGKLFKGIAQSGIWCGFDEINRVHLEVLSVVAAQIQCVFLAMRDRLEQFTFVDGTEVGLDSNAGVFITMNPGYAGRTELPENMKALFRTIAVVVPDRQIIMRVKLAASGFQENMDLSKKFFILYRLCEEQLSKQTHYDFGLRNILSVLRTCGSNKRINPDATETSILMRVLRDMNLSKLVDEDVPLFLSLIADLFPGVQVEKEGYPELMQAISDHAMQAGLICHEDWVLKVIQFYEQWRVRHGLCVMGPSGAGKTSMISTLAKALSVVHTPVKEMKMNPKAITATQMFGRLDVQTNDWTDGIFSALWRRACKRKEGNTWVELDGPVDAIWIENLNTVLDDTRTLTLANGDRLVMPPSLKLIFEVGNLDNASPATVSRMGMVYMGPTALGWTPVLKSWLQGSLRSDPEVAKINDIFTQYCESFASFVQMECESKMAIPLVNLVSSALRLLRGLLPYNEEGVAIKIKPDHVEKLAIFAFMWSIGGLLELNDKKKVDTFLREKTELDVPKKQRDEDIVYDYVVDENGEWVHWQERVVQWDYPADVTPDFHKILVPTVDSVRTEYLVDVIARQKLAVLLIGESGTAKTVTVKQYLEKQDPDVIKNKMIAFSSATLPGIFQRTVEAFVEKRMGTSYGPPPGKRMVVFVDDVNMPEVNEWGDQVTNEIVRQLIEEGGFYSLDRPGDWLGIVDVSYLAAMNHPGGGRNDIPSRLKRHFNVFNVTLPSPESVENIYGTIATGHFCASRAFAQDVVETAKALPSLTRQLWEKTKTKMLPTPSKFHYIFNLRDLSRIFQGMLVATSETIVDRILLLKLWKHECYRVIPDKFNAPSDFVWFDETMQHIIADEFPAGVSQEMEAAPHFVDFLREEIIPEDENEEAFTPKIYEPIQSWEELQARLEEYMVTYNDMYRKAPMNLVLFEFAMEHLVRISRVIRTPRGNALLVGVGGSGKQSLTRLASFIAGYKTFQIVITKTYSVSNLFDDLKALYRTAAIESPVVFLFTDNEIKEEGFLEYINMILTSGEISGLFPRDELDMVIEDIRPIARKEQPGIIDTSENLYKFFIDRARNNLHVVLCFSPVGEKFRSRARKFPGLISGCTIDWFPPWPPEALHATASRFLSDFSVVAEPRAS
jgi:dynein heavy chain, axonemal